VGAGQGGGYGVGWAVVGPNAPQVVMHVLLRGVRCGGGITWWGWFSSPVVAFMVSSWVGDVGFPVGSPGQACTVSGLPSVGPGFFPVASNGGGSWGVVGCLGGGEVRIGQGWREGLGLVG
jgi:hypothetical protein